MALVAAPACDAGLVEPAAPAAVEADPLVMLVGDGAAAADAVLDPAPLAGVEEVMPVGLAVAPEVPVVFSVELAALVGAPLAVLEVVEVGEVIPVEPVESVVEAAEVPGSALEPLAAVCEAVVPVIPVGVEVDTPVVEFGVPVAAAAPVVD